MVQARHGSKSRDVGREELASRLQLIEEQLECERRVARLRPRAPPAGTRWLYALAPVCFAERSLRSAARALALARQVE